MQPAIGRPAPNEYLPYYRKYIELITEPDVLSVLDSQPAEVRRLAASVPESREHFRYAPGKWSVRQVFGHLIDVERIFGYRALRISRRDETPLSGFDENTYVANGPYDEIAVGDLAEEFAVVRAANVLVLRRLDGAHAQQMGTANAAPISVRALAYILAGHVRHHVRGLGENYAIA